MLAKLAVWYLRKTNKSVFINFELEDGKITPFSNEAMYFDSEFYGVKIHTADGKEVVLPEGAFSLKIKQ